MKLLMLVWLLMLCPQRLPAEDTPDELAERVSTRIASIKSELATLNDHPWAGEYYAGDGLGMNLTLWIAPKAGVAYQWHGCLGLYEQNLGAVRQKNGQLLFEWELRPDDPYVTDSHWLPIRWQKSVYLVPTIFVHRFCCAARERDLLPMMALQSQVAIDAPAVALPRLPVQFAVFRNLAPIEPHLLSTGKSDRKALSKTADIQSQEITIDAGTNQHVLAGMRFEATYPKRPGWILTITDVDLDSATGIVEINRKPNQLSVSSNKRWRFRPASW